MQQIGRLRAAGLGDFFAAMLILFLGGLAVSLWAEYGVNPVIDVVSAMEGKEVRFGVTNSVLWATAIVRLGRFCECGAQQPFTAHRLE